MAAKKKKAIKTVKNKTRLMATAPDELQSFWNDEVSDAWGKLRPIQQDFLKEYLTNGNNASAAYREIYNPTALAKHVSALAFQVLASNSIQIILQNLSKGKEAIFLHCQNKLLEASEALKPVFNKEGDSAIDVEDHPTRIKAVSELAKLNGLMIDKTENKSTVNNTLNIINQEVLGEMNQYLSKIGQKPIEPLKKEIPQAPVIPEDDDTFESFGDSNMRVVE